MNHSLSAEDRLPKEVNIRMTLGHTLRYGISPDQAAGSYDVTYNFDGEKYIVEDMFELVDGLGIGYNNTTDILGAAKYLNAFGSMPGYFFASTKHGNACGASYDTRSKKRAITGAETSDGFAPYGGIMVANFRIGAGIAEHIARRKTRSRRDYRDILISSEGFTDRAIQILQSVQKRKMQLVHFKKYDQIPFDVDPRRGLVQEATSYSYDLERSKLEFVTKTEPTRKELNSMLILERMVRPVQSNAVLVGYREGTNVRTFGVGGPMSKRVDAAEHAVDVMSAPEFTTDCQLSNFDHRRKHPLDGDGPVQSASDGPYPYIDSVERQHEAGVTQFMQPGGSVGDNSCIKYCNIHGLVMVLTRKRCFA